jgi:protein-S-isoprenylcysteine O-methyltransferase Ste14
MSREVVMVARLIVQTFVWYAVIGSVLFLAAGTVDWPAAWLLLAEMVAISLVGGLGLIRRDPGLVAERLRPPIQKDQPTADKFLLIVVILALVAAHVLMALDAVRFAWSYVPPWIQAVGQLILLLSLWISLRTLRENSFAAPVVKIQRDRGQTVISTGPYRHVRHPMYAGALAYFAGTSLLLGSWWGLAAVLVVAVLLGIRIGIEEKALRAGLQGYDDYAARVRYRLIPLVW